MAQRSFEKDLERLEQVVKDLEEGDLPLDESLKRFEEGVRLARACEKALTQAEKRIEALVKDDDGNLVAEPLDGDAEAGRASDRADVGEGDGGGEGEADAAEEGDEDEDEDESELLF